MYVLTEVIPKIITSYFLQFANREFLLLMGAVVLLIALQYRRTEVVRSIMFGMKPQKYWKDSLFAVFLGLGGGLFGSILIILTGIPLSGSGNVFILLLLIAAVLMVINPRFICFAYAGGIISLSNIIIGWPSVNVYQILALVALLHMVESLLIFFSGHLGAVPTFFGDGKGKAAGGFTLQKFWPIPLVALIAVGYSDAQDFLSAMPAWWPLIKAGTADSSMAGFALVSVVAGLGYGDLAISHTPAEKRKISALLLSLYSIVLFGLAVLSQHFHFLIWLAAFFSPLGHELVIEISRRIELAGKPRYTASPLGARVLDVIPGFLAWEVGIRSGDIVTSLNGMPVYNHWDINAAMEDASGPVEIEFLQGRHQIFKREWTGASVKEQSLGILLVSQVNEKSYVEINPPSILGGIVADYWKK